MSVEHWVNELSKIQQAVSHMLAKLPYHVSGRTYLDFQVRDKGREFIVVYNALNHAHDCRKCRGRATEIGIEITPQKRKFLIGHIELNRHYQNRGWGRATVEAIEDMAQELGYSTVRVWNNRNQDFWKHLGYQRNKKGLDLKK